MRPLRAPRKRNVRDPAPSRVAYRLNRLWLTPEFHKLLKFGLPSSVLLITLGLFFSDLQRQEAVLDWAHEVRRSIEERPEFMVNLMAIDGASDELALDIRDVLPVDLPTSSFDLDLEAMRQQVESLDAVKQVDMQVKTGGVLQIEVTERLPAVVWRSVDGLELLDAEGNRVSALDSRQNRSDLLLIAGDGANDAVPEALALARAAGPVRDTLIGLMRVSEGRWDVVLDGGDRIMLPESGALAALYRAVAMEEAQNLLAQDKVSRIDFRNPDRPILRLAPGASIDRNLTSELIDVKDKK